MSHLSNRTVLQKADFALSHLVSNGGLLHPLQDLAAPGFAGAYLEKDDIGAGDGDGAD